MAQTDGDTARELFLIDGNSLAYRAFFALPESIATSDGRPTNAIFGFASMLVKILTDYGEVPTVVVWDAGMSGRKEISADYKAQRSHAAPTCSSCSGRTCAPLVEAFGYRNVSVEGYEADDVIAALAEQAQERGIPVMVVTGDRDAYQLVDDGVRIMTTSRGITDTKVYDRQGVIDRYGIPPELVPDFIGLKGDTSDNIPGVPGIGDKTAAELLQRFGDARGGARQRRRDLRRQAQAEPDRARGRRAHLQAARDDGPRRPGRPRPRGRARPASPTARNLRAVFRDWELRDPLRRLEEALEAAELEAIPRPETPTARAVAGARGRRRRRRDAAPARSSRSSPRRPSSPEGELLPREQRLALRRLRAAAAHALAGEVADPAELVEARRRPAGRRPRREGARRRPRRPRLRHEVAAYLLDPARRGYPLDELAEERGIGRRRPTTPQAARAVLVHELAAAPARAAAERGLDRPAARRSSCRSCASCARPRRPASSSTPQRLEEAAHAHPRRRRRSSSARSGSWRARSS